MPLDKKSREMESNFERQYGPKEGERAFYATLNKGINRGKPYKVGESKRLMAKRKHKKKRRRNG